MRKILLSLIILSAATFALGQSERMPFGEKSNYTLNKKITRPARMFGSNKSVIYSENFDSYTDAFAEKWIVNRSTDLTGDNLVDATSPMWFLCKPTNFNGNGSNYIYSGDRSAAISYTAQNNTWLFGKDTISIPSETGYTLNFWLWYYNNTYYQYITYFHVMVFDVDAQAWDLVKSWDETSGSNQFLNRVALSLDEYSGKRIRLAFVYENRDGQGSQLAIDDISILNTSSPDLTINGLEYNYSSVPSFIADTFKIPFNAIVKNIGSKLEDTASISVTSMQLTGFLSEAEITDTLEEGESKFVKTDSLLQIKNQGQYIFVYSVEADQDEFADNNTDTSKFEVSSDIYATDFGIAGGMSLGMDQEFGNIYYVPEPCFIKGVQIGWPSFANPNFSAFEFELNIYELNSIDSTISNILYSEIITKDASQSDSYFSISFNPIFCNAGANYFVTVRQLDNLSIGIGYDKISNGSFWKFGGGKGDLEKLINPSIGNIALRLLMNEPDLEPKLTFSINDGTSPVADLDIEIVGIDTLKTDVSGQADIKLKNGLYRYNIYPANFAPIRDTIKILYQDVTLDLTLQKLYKAKFVVKSGSTPIPNAEINISDSLVVTNSQGIDSVYIVPKTHIYTITASGYESFTDYLTITSKDTIVNISLTAAETYNVKFTILDDSSNPVPSAKLNLTGYGSKYSNDLGEVTFIGVQPASLIFYSVTKFGFEIGGGTVDVVDQDVDVDVELIMIRYKVTFFVSNGNVGLPNAQVKLGTLTAVTTNSNGYAEINDVAPATDIAYTITVNNFHSLTGKVTVIDSDIRENVLLTALSSPKNNEFSYTIFPNPSYGIFRITGESIQSISVFDLTGNLVQTQKDNSLNNEIDIASSPAGIYFIKIQGKNGVVVKRLIKK